MGPTRSVGRWTAATTILLGTMTAATAAASSAAARPVTTRVSVSSSAVQGQTDSYAPTISGDGRYIAFESMASNLVPGDTNGLQDVFIHDRRTGRTSRVSVGSNGRQADGMSWLGSITDDGRLVAFESDAANLVPGDTNRATDVFVHDRETGQTSLVSVRSDGKQANKDSMGGAITSRGRLVAFDSFATNLVRRDRNRRLDVFVHDRRTGETTCASLNPRGNPGSGQSDGSRLSSRGRFVLFRSWATDLVSDDTNRNFDVFLHDRKTGETIRVNVSSEGEQARGDSDGGTISANGRFIGFESDAPNLVPDDHNGIYDSFVYDRKTHRTMRISLRPGGREAKQESFTPSFSATGRYMSFGSWDPKLVRGDTNGAADVFVYDRRTGKTTRVSVGTGETQARLGGYSGSMSLSGRWVVFDSDAANLVPGDTNRRCDVFLRGPLR